MSDGLCLSARPVWQEYTREVLAWKLGQDNSLLAPDEEESIAYNAAARLMRMADASGRPFVVLLGVGQGLTAALLLHSLPAHQTLIVLESSPHQARAALSRFPHLTPHLLVDTSPWALLLLALDAGLTPDNATMGRNAAQLPADVHTLDHWRSLFCGAQREILPEVFSPDLRISVGAILHPAEPRLQEFFAQIPHWIHEVCVVWDRNAPVLPGNVCAAPLFSHMRPLGGNFGEQRNAMLDLCSGDWCFYLDADERFAPAHWALLPMLASIPGAGGVLFPRLTFEGDTHNARMGYGLWPDVQCRFFPLHADARFHGTIHEQIRGLGGHRILAPGIPILHYSHVHKSSTEVERKLRIFDEATGYTQHKHSAAYPALPAPQLAALGHAFGHTAVLRLPAYL